MLAATSGDTGAAVTEACAGVPGVRAVVLYPRVGVSGVQESQIARPRPGVVALSVDGTFDDCQDLVKAMFAEKKILSPGRVAEAIGTTLPLGFTLQTGPEVLTARFTRGGRRITYLVNYHAGKVEVPLTLVSGSSQSFDVYNPMDGAITAQKVPGSVTIDVDVSLFLVEPADSARASR